ncbi:hypothetical protein NBRC111894_2889 [Sporolactobacillus inulinus]|uniref:Uncharacterized protein n=1 Tax=Sporolactobacillus inulinus TaxID=2078 RepID=A0A4Y1ZE20_9BACL|nr:hypothetical protein NBRC111894_2889 [Sporolactobacillus inulinus]
MAKNQSEGSRRLRDRALLMRASETPQIPALSEEARGAPAASE